MSARVAGSGTSGTIGVGGGVPGVVGGVLLLKPLA
jgi:hypothetical protein